MNKNAHELKENVVVSQEIKGSICIKKIIVVLFFVTIIIYASVYFYMENKHNEAIDYLNKQEYDKAYKVLEDLGELKLLKKLKKVNILE